MHLHVRVQTVAYHKQDLSNAMYTMLSSSNYFTYCKTTLLIVLLAWIDIHSTSLLAAIQLLHDILKWVGIRAATDPANPEPDLLTTRIRHSRSGSVKKIVLLNLEHKFGH